MRFSCYSIKDEQDGYRMPMIGGSDGDMKRSFAIECKNPESLLNKCPQDFSLWKVGEWDTENGVFINLKEPKLIERRVNIIGNLQTPRREA